MEQELSILLLSNDVDALDYFYRLYSSSISGRRDTTLFTKESDKGFIINMESERSRVVEQANVYLKSMGFRLEIEYEDDEETEEEIEVECDTPKIPSYIEKLFS